MANSFSHSAFAQNFMAGFQFVDQIKRAKRAEQRLEERLAEEKADRAYQRKRQRRADIQAQQDRQFMLQEREYQLNAREEQKLGAKLALQEDPDINELIRLAPNSPAAFKRAEQILGKEKLAEALQTAGTIPVAGVGATASDVTGGGLTSQAGAASASAQAAAGQPVTPGVASDATAQAAGTTPQSTSPVTAGSFAPAAGTGGLQRITEEQATAASREYKEKGFAGRIGDVAVGQASQTVRALGDIAKAPFTGAEAIVADIRGIERVTSPQNIGQEFGGDILVPDDKFFDDTELSSDPAERVRQLETNEQTIRELTARGRNPEGNVLRPLSRQGALAAGSDELRREREHVNRVIDNRYSDFIDTREIGKLERMAAEDPAAAAVQYLNDRATLANVRPDLLAEVDRRMVPVFDAYEEAKTAELTAMPDGPEKRQAARALGNLQASRDQIAKDQPPIPARADISDAGLKVGDTTRAQDVVDVIYDDTQPTVQHATPAELKAAATVAGRITPSTKRLNTKQIEAVALLAQQGWIDKPTAFSVMTTGQWPPGKDPNGIKELQAHGEVLYGVTNAGGVRIVADSKGSKTKPVPSKEITEDTLDWVVEGAKLEFPNLDDSRAAQLQGLVNRNASWLRANFEVTSQEQMRLAGQMWAQSFLLSAKEYQRRDDSFFTTTKNSPKPEEIFFNPELRDQLAARFDVTLIDVPPARTFAHGVDPEIVRQSLRAGDFGQVGMQIANEGTDDMVLEYVARWSALEHKYNQAKGQ